MFGNIAIIIAFIMAPRVIDCYPMDFSHIRRPIDISL